MLVSIRWKKKRPPSKTTQTPTADAAIAAPGGCPCPVSAQRKPSITPAMGLSPYSQRHRADVAIQSVQRRSPQPDSQRGKDRQNNQDREKQHRRGWVDPKGERQHHH